jgi:hypothetical protein
MRSLLVILFLFTATVAFAQSGAGSQDSAVNGDLRPRSTGAYVVGCFPSPAMGGQPITVQTYNRNPTELSVTIYDNAGRDMLDLIPRQTMPGGLQTMTIPPYRLPSGVYHVELLTYTSSDPSAAVDIVDNDRFVILH